MVTKHAEKRIRQRCGVSKKAAQRMTEKVYKYGMTHSETTGKLKKYVDSLYFYNRIANQIRLYGDKVYLFHNKDLITVIQVPNNLVKHIKNKKVERDG